MMQRIATKVMAFIVSIAVMALVAKARVDAVSDRMLISDLIRLGCDTEPHPITDIACFFTTTNSMPLRH